MANMMKSKRVEFTTLGMLHGKLHVKCELQDGTVWQFIGTASVDLGMHGGSTVKKNKTVKAELRWPDSGRAKLAGYCAWSGFNVGTTPGPGIGGFIMWDRYGTVAHLAGVQFGMGSSVVPVGWGQWKQLPKWD